MLLGCLLIVVSLFGVFLSNNTFAACNSQGYCYGTGGNPRGGSCGDPNNNGPWWDTCFGLSWQYYEWPQGYTGDIAFPGSTNAGRATVSGQCAEYGGFWFLGYEVYNPHTHESLGYQAGAPRVGMLADYSPNGYAQLYVGESPAPNPSINLTKTNGERVRLSGAKYGNVDDMNNEIEERLFNHYAENGTLVSGSGNGATGTSFADVNWFCAAAPPPPIPEDPKIMGRVEVKSGNSAKTTWWNETNEATINISINEGETATITFNDYMVGDGTATTKNYTVSGDFVGEPAETGMFVAFEDDREPQIVGTHTQTVNTAGKYCEFLEFNDKGVERIMHACANVKVIPTPPDVFGRIGVEATIYDGDGSVKNTVSLTETAWNDTSEPPLTIPVHLDDNDYVSIHFVDSMKGEGATAADIDYAISNNAIAGVLTEGIFAYAGGSASGQATTIKTTDVNDVNQRSLICETLNFGDDLNGHTVVACVEVTKDDYPDLETSKSGDGEFDFNVDVALKLSVSLSNNLVKDSGINGEFLRDYTTLGVSSNNHAGYIATFTTDKKSTNENATNLIHDYRDSILPTLDTSVVRSEFPIGKWGYSMDDTLDGDDTSTYGPLVAMDSVSPIVVMDTNEPSSGSQDIYFGARMGPTQPTGTYSNSIVFKIVAKVTEPAPTTIQEIEYMQEINDDVIASMVPEQQYQLTDKRDGKKYWVVKLKNDYVVMSQDLAYELHYGDVLSSDTTDIGYGDFHGGYKSGRSYWFVDQTTKTDKNEIPGYRVKGDGDELPYYVGGNSYELGTMGELSFLNIPNEYSLYSDGNLRTEYYLSDAECASSTEFTEDECSHMRVGVKYNLYTAMAGGDKTRYSSQQTYNLYRDSVGTDSVCPKGWRMFTYGERDVIYNRFKYDGFNFREAPLYFRSFWLARSYESGIRLTFYEDNYDISYEYSETDNNLNTVRCVARYGMKE